MSGQHQPALMAITRIIHTRARPMATMDRNGLWAGCSLAPARGITAIGGVVTAITDAVAMVTTDAAAMATTAAATTDRELTDTGAELVMALAMPAARLAVATRTVRLAVAFMAEEAAEASMEAADGGKRPRFTSSNPAGTNTASRFCLPDDPTPPHPSLNRDGR